MLGAQSLVIFIEELKLKECLFVLGGTNLFLLEVIHQFIPITYYA